MKTLTLRTGELQQISLALFQGWDSYKNKVNLTPKALYSLIALKRNIETHARTLQDTVNALAEKNGGIVQPNGSFEIPDEKKIGLQDALNEFAKEQVEIEYRPICLGENDQLPIELMDILFQFLEMAE